MNFNTFELYIILNALYLSFTISLQKPKEHLNSVALFTNINLYVIEHIDNSNPQMNCSSKPTTTPVKQIQSARQIEDYDNGTNDLLVLEPYCFIFS